jgi:hypothetical protein
MTFVLLHAGIPIGRVDLDDGDPAGGTLMPLPAYDAIAEPFRREGGLLWRRRAPWVEFPVVFSGASAIVAEERKDGTVQQEAEEARERLSLATEHGQQVTVAWIDIADAPAQREPPLVLVYFREAPAGVRAILPTRPRAGSGESPPAA